MGAWGVVFVVAPYPEDVEGFGGGFGGDGADDLIEGCFGDGGFWFLPAVLGEGWGGEGEEHDDEDRGESDGHGEAPVGMWG